MLSIRVLLIASPNSTNKRNDVIADISLLDIRTDKCESEIGPKYRSQDLNERDHSGC